MKPQTPIRDPVSDEQAGSNVYRYMLDNDVTYFEQVNGKILRVEDEDYVQLLVSLQKIETFIAEVLTSDEPAFVMVSMASGHKRLYERPLARYFSTVEALSRLSTYGYIVSVTIQLFYECWAELEMGREAFAGTRGYSSILGKEPFERFNDFLECIRKRGKSPAFRRRVSRRKEGCLDNQRSGQAYLGALFQKTYAKLLVLRVDFSYLHPFSQTVTPDQARKDIGRLFKRAKQQVNLGKHLLGYIWKLEWAPRKRYHFHTIIIYDGHYRKADIYLAQKLGELWSERITEGRGIYWNCNRYKDKYTYLGIGQIHKNDTVKRGHLIQYVLGYLTKTDQYLLADTLRQGRRFHTGHLASTG